MCRLFSTKDAEWTLNVKVKGGWVCEDCGELDRELLEAHHIVPRSVEPSKAYDINNGKSVCLWCHAIAHMDHPAVRDKILARLAVILYRRLYPRCRLTNTKSKKMLGP
jgi:predicted HNH restriction endonuclease